MSAFCAYRERCSSEVRDKMNALQLPEPLQEQLIDRLQKENYLNDERFALAFAHGKFRHKQWGKVKIRLMLKQKQLPDVLIRKALNQIDSEEYWQTLLSLAEKKAAELMRKPRKVPLQHALFHFLTGKGFEADLAAQAARQVIQQS